MHTTQTDRLGLQQKNYSNVSVLYVWNCGYKSDCVGGFGGKYNGKKGCVAGPETKET